MTRTYGSPPKRLKPLDHSLLSVPLVPVAFDALITRKFQGLDSSPVSFNPPIALISARRGSRFPRYFVGVYRKSGSS